MADCTRYKDMISGFADGELSDKEKTEVQKHLDACPVCQALLTAYRSITEATEESMEEPPEDFAGSIMERIKALPTETGQETKRHKGKSVKPVIISFVAAAACLALAFIVSPQLFDFGGSSKTASSAAPVPESAPMAQASSSIADTTGGSGTAASPAAKAADSTQTESAPNYGASTAPLMTGAADAPETGNASAAGRQTDTGGAPLPASSAAPIAPIQSALQSTPPADAAVNLERYYAVISVKGQLPAVLADVVMTQNGDGTESFEISAERADQLIADGYPAVMGNKTAAAALVVYTP